MFSLGPIIFKLTNSLIHQILIPAGASERSTVHQLTKTMSSIQNIIFDLGGVVVNWDPDAVVAEVFDDPAMQAHVKQTMFQHPDWLEMDRGTLSEADAIPIFADRTGLSEDRVVELLRTADRILLPKPDTLELIRELHDRGFSLYCLSNIPSERYAFLKAQHNFFDLFKGAVISGDLGLVKPEKEIYEYLFETYHLEPASCVFLDDMPINIDGARAVGMHGIIFTDAASCRTRLLDML